MTNNWMTKIWSTNDWPNGSKPANSCTRKLWIKLTNLKVGQAWSWPILGATTRRIMTFSITTLSLMCLSATISINNNQYHSIKCSYAECNYAEWDFIVMLCQYAVCRYAECRGAIFYPSKEWLVRKTKGQAIRITRQICNILCLANVIKHLLCKTLC